MEAGNEDEMKLAISGMNSRYRSSNPLEPKLVKGKLQQLLVMCLNLLMKLHKQSMTNAIHMTQLTENL